MSIKLSVLLAKTDHLANQFRTNIREYITFFKDKQGAFRGERKTYDAKAGTVDQPGKRGNKLVQTTVSEKLKYLVETNAEYIDALFSQEATNAVGTARADLMVEGKSLGNYSSLELLRLKSLLENGEFEQMYSLIPVRSDEEEWASTTQEMYRGREIMEGHQLTGVEKSIYKEPFIIPDPNISQLKDSSAYKAQVGQRDTVIELGDYTFQKFTGEYSHRQRAEILRRRSKLLNSVIEALKTANDVEAVSSNMSAAKLFGYLHEGSL
jgi:hypothetical protein